MTNSSVRSELANTARAIIRDFGERLTLLRKSTGNYDVDTGVRSFTTTEYCVRVAFVRDDKDESADLTRSESRRAYIAPVDCSTIETNDVITGVGGNMKVSRIHEALIGRGGGVVYVCTLQG